MRHPPQKHSSPRRGVITFLSALLLSRVPGSFLVCLALLASIALAVGPEDVDPVGHPVQQSAGQTFAAEDLGPFCEREVGGHYRV